MRGRQDAHESKNWNGRADGYATPAAPAGERVKIPMWWSSSAKPL